MRRLYPKFFVIISASSGILGIEVREYMTVFTIANQTFQQGSFLTMAQSLNQIFVSIKLIVALFGAVTICIGAILAIYRYLLFQFSKTTLNTNDIRLNLAKNISLALEFFVAADVIETTIAPDFSSLGILAVLVLIRTMLNYSMEREIKNLSLSENNPAR